MNSYYPWSKLKQLEERRGDWKMIKELGALQRIEATLHVYLKDSVFLEELGITFHLDKEAFLKDINLIREALKELEDVKHNYKATEKMSNNVFAYAGWIQNEVDKLKKDWTKTRDE